MKNGILMKVESFEECFGAVCNTFDLHEAIMGLEKQFSVFLENQVLLDFSLTVTAATLIFISGCGLAISCAKEGKSGFIYDLVENKLAF